MSSAQRDALSLDQPNTTFCLGFSENVDHHRFATIRFAVQALAVGLIRA
jgi:hypothetical protein